MEKKPGAQPYLLLVLKGQRKVRYRSTEIKARLLCRVCQRHWSGYVPIFDAKSLNMKWTKGEVFDTTCGLSGNGWMDMELFKMWFLDHFLKHVVSACPFIAAS